MKRLGVLAGLAVISLGIPTHALANEGVRASMTVVRGLHVGTVSPMLLRSAREGGALGASAVYVTAEAPAVVQISGDPGRAYSIRAGALPSDVLSDVTISSANTGELAGGGSSRMDARGHDLLRISASYVGTMEAGRASLLPLSISYE